MYIKCLQSDLWEAIQIVQKAISIRSTLPILSGILFQARKKELILSGTNLELSIKCSIPAEIKEEGSIVIPARLIGDIIKNLPEATIELFLDSSSNQIKLSCQESKFNIKTLLPEDFPKFPELKIEQSCVISSSELIKIIKQITKAASIDETRPILTGVLLNINKNRFKMVATDSYRLAIKEVELKEGIEDKIQAIIPSRTLNELIKIISGEEHDIILGFTGNQLIFKEGNTVLITRLIEGQYPNYQQLLPEKYEFKVSINKEALLGAVRRVLLFTQNNSPVKIKIQDKMMELNAATADVGEAIERINTEGDGRDINIAFNPQYFLDGLMSVNEEKVVFEGIDATKPALIKPEGKENFLYLIMPMRVV
ncbi:DNA polymerase III subunit beta [Candidatus Oleimmundimicrobium sp.]|uniref:DNA polymerase III subunit beta n=1 Tax=Candidatus Oleimmundimicrobium sp. TaxID=3060597 RepID=UPI002715A8BC|nr:DNA polymerase III subunit beta [Candidatus Oleimmundimicrobium sp.]MDO8886379.1 DNA polymerase III subunit beta [Candidatus Oleimmundimicrobium sp.]